MYFTPALGVKKNQQEKETIKQSGKKEKRAKINTTGRKIKQKLKWNSVFEYSLPI